MGGEGSACKAPSCRRSPRGGSSREIAGNQGVAPGFTGKIGAEGADIPAGHGLVVIHGGDSFLCLDATRVFGLVQTRSVFCPGGDERASGSLPRSGSLFKAASRAFARVGLFSTDVTSRMCGRRDIFEGGFWLPNVRIPRITTPWARGNDFVTRAERLPTLRHAT